MIKRRSEMQTRVVEGARGGNGCVQFLDLMREEETLGKLRVVCEITLEKGCSIGRHPHGPDAEIYIMTQGTAVVDDNGEISTVSAGDVIYTGGGAFHALANEEDKPVKLFALVIN